MFEILLESTARVIVMALSDSWQCIRHRAEHSAGIISLNPHKSPWWMPCSTRLWLSVLQGLPWSASPGNFWEWKLLGLTLDLQNQNLYFNKSTRESHMLRSDSAWSNYLMLVYAPSAVWRTEVVTLCLVPVPSANSMSLLQLISSFQQPILL